ncbi:MAG: ThuA domain-containing protein [Pirellulales bacterium]
MTGQRRWVLGLLLLMAFPPIPEAQLSRAYGELPEGLIVHLDATVAEVGLVDELRDLAVANRVFVQPEEAARPEVVAVGESRVLRFDGVDDHLRSVGTGLESDAFTLFVVAAPHANPGDFRGFFAANASGQRDYESGFNVDLGPGPSRSFDVLNVEGKGFGGAQDLRQASTPFGGLHLLEVVADLQAGEIRLLVDGSEEGKRPFAGDTLSLDELTLGGRYYTNGPGPQQVRGSLAGDVAEVLLFDRVLLADEATAVRERLLARHAALAESLRETPLAARDGGVPLELVKNPPLIQMLVPGFEVREIPVQLANVNNVRFREDGALVALGYGGDIHVLRDTDGDGLEDTATRWFHNEGSLRGPIGLLVTPPGYEHGDGVFVASKGKVSLFLDHDGDDSADEERVVATGWQEITQNVDATGLAMGPDGSVYFALDVADYSNAYLLDAEGKSHYDVRSERGTIQRISPDLSQREAVCTGIRFPIALAFNDRGDLFCTEQEGATWMPNGNPFDELLHVRLDGTAPRWNVTGMQHFGFPPRHPRHNPGVLDEPSTFDYGPQHQSACGMVFNPAVAERKPFGPGWWAGDALVCGESRGKLWRTTLVPTAVGYVATNQLVAALQMLCVDACVAGNGDLVVACHSGPPDWGTGPAGVGKLFRISMRSAEAPRPVVAWAEGPREIRVAFDRPLNPVSLAGVAEKTVVEYGAYVRAADRFETLEPPYAVVQAQKMALRHQLRVVSAALTADRRTLVLGTDPIPVQTHVAVSLPWSDDTSTTRPRDGSLVQQAAIDVDTSTAGVAVHWVASETPSAIDDQRAADAAAWLPHLDLAVSARLTAGSAGHDDLWARLQTPGELQLATRLNLTQLLRPAVQPGSQLDHEWPPETATITITSDREIEVEASVAGSPLEVMTSINARGDVVARFETPAGVEELVDLRLSVATGDSRRPQLTITFHTNEDGTERPLPLHRFILPWAISTADEPSTGPLQVAELEGGNWGRGRRVFLSDAAGCSKCHSVAGDGKMIGPDLGNLVHRDFASVSRDIRNPSFAINPDFTTHIVHLADGRVLTGILQTRDDSLMLGDSEGRWTRLERDAIELMEPSAVSVMPSGILDKLSAEETRDLLTYLLTPPPAMPLESPRDPPPVRSQAEVTAALAGSEEVRAARPLSIVLIDGEKDHGPGEHDYPAWRNRWVQLLAAAEQVTVTPASEFPSPEQLETADVLVFFQRGSFADRRPQAMDAFLARGGGAVYIHWAVDGRDRAGEFSRRIGLASDAAISFRHGPLELAFRDGAHPIIRNFTQLSLHDESYWKLIGNPTGLDVLATSLEDGEPTPQLWTKEVGEGRVFVSIPGHYSWTFDDPLFRILLLRGIAWAAHEPVDRFNDLVTPGARMSR